MEDWRRSEKKEEFGRERSKGRCLKSDGSLAIPSSKRGRRGGLEQAGFPEDSRSEVAEFSNMIAAGPDGTDFCFFFMVNFGICILKSLCLIQR